MLYLSKKFTYKWICTIQTVLFEGQRSLWRVLGPVHSAPPPVAAGQGQARGLTGTAHGTQIPSAMRPQACATLWFHHMTLCASALFIMGWPQAPGPLGTPVSSRPPPSRACRRLCSWITWYFPETAVLSSSSCQPCESGADSLLLLVRGPGREWAAHGAQDVLVPSLVY